MSFRELVHNCPTFMFDGTNYNVWKVRMLNLFRDIGPNYIKSIVDVGFSPPKDSRELSLEDEENSHLDTLVSNSLICVLSDVVLASIMPFRSTHELWTKLQDIYMKCPILLRMIVLPPPLAEISSQLIPLHQHVICHKVMKW